MVSANTLINQVLNVKDMYNESVEFTTNPQNSVREIRIHARPYKRLMDRCPYCMRKCPHYDRSENKKAWRALDWSNQRIWIIGPANRVSCPEHGIVTVWVPWAEPNTNFTKDFDYLVVWLGERLSKKDVAELMMIDWETVGRCMSRVRYDLEPDTKVRYNGLVNIGVDETSYKKGHKYITVVVDHDRNQVIWVHKGKGKEVLDTFFKELTEEQRASIKVVTGDGARWISDSVREFCPNATRCMDSFHVVEWVNDTLGNLRVSLYKKAQNELKRLEKMARDQKESNGNTDTDLQYKQIQDQIEKAKETVDDLGNTKYPLGKNPEKLTENQQIKLELIQNSYPELYKAYQMKETIRLLLHLTDEIACATELNEWIETAKRSNIDGFKALADKIERNKQYIINTIEKQVSNARIESTNNKIKLIVRKAFGFRNIEHLKDMIMLVCSDLKIQLPNRPLKKVA